MKRVLLLLGVGITIAAGAGVKEAAAPVSRAFPWNMKTLERPPQTWPFGTGVTNGIRTIFYEGAPYRNRPTRIFAYLGLPKVKPGEKVPGIVLVHGGAGSAFYRWVKLWNDRGYAAISMDTCGAVGGNTVGNEQRGHLRHAWAGPGGWGGFKAADEPLTEQWPYHAVAAVIRGHSLLRSLPEVDAARIGITGVSWGGWLTCLAASADGRFAFAAPVYGCGFLDDNSVWRDSHFEGLTPAQAARWAKLWDPRHYLARASAPFLWVDGSNDFAYPLDSLQSSYHALRVPYLLCTRLRMPHAHGAPGEQPAEILAFADQCVNRGPRLPVCLGADRKGIAVTARFAANGFKIARCVLNFTCDKGKWQKRLWKEIPMTFSDGVAHGTLPNGVTVWYVNAVLENGMVVSSEHEEL